MAKRYYCDRCDFQQVQGVPGDSPLTVIKVAGEEKEICPACDLIHKKMSEEAEAAFDAKAAEWMTSWKPELPFADAGSDQETGENDGQD